MRWKKLAVVVSTAALALGAACAGSPPQAPGPGPGDTAEPKDTSTVGDTTDAAAKAPAAEIPDAQKGGTVTVYADVAPHTLDPTRVYYIDANAIMRLVTRALTQWQYRDGKMVLVPDMATDLGTPNEDFTEWKFTLRDGLKYEDGTAVKAQDVAHAVKRQLAVEELPDGPLYGLDYYLDGDKYKGPFKSAAQGGGDDFRGVETPDDKTIIFHMQTPFADLPFYASFPAFTAIPKAKDTQEDYGLKPLATGPYKFEKLTPEKELTLVKNDQWDPATDTNRHQYPDKYHFLFAQDPVRFQAQLIADQGQDQTAMTYTNILAEKLPEVQGKEPEERLVKGRDTCVSYVWLDTRKIPLEVRRALATAYPISSLRKAAGSIPGLTWEPATSIMSPITPGYVASDAIGHKGDGDGEPQKAKQMLEEAGELGFELQYYFATDHPTAPTVSQLRKQKLEAAGFKVKALPTTIEKQRELLNDADAPVNLRFSGWCLDWPSGASVFPAQWDPRKIELPGVPNPAFLDVPEIATRIDEITKLPVEEGLGKWGELDKWIMENHLPIIPTAAGGNAILHGSKVGNVNWDEYLGMPDFTGMYVMQ
jgi:peptide/nickel transport system substrate-binding protein